MKSPDGRSPEVDLLLLCALWPPRDEDRQRVRSQAALPLDWDRFLELVRHHRLVPLVAHNLHAAIAESASPDPRAALATLAVEASANTFRALRSLAELRRLLQEFQARGIPVRVLKGLPLAQSVFGDLNLRATGDIDLLIDEASILQADEVLRGFNYRGLFHLHEFTPKRLAFYGTHWKDVAYVDPATGFEVDLHWRCFRNREMPGAGLCAAKAPDTVSFGTFEVPTPPATETLLYLCVHGTLDGWLYLKSLVDIAAQVRAMAAPQLDAVASQASVYGVLPEVSAALLLVRRYLALEAWSAALLPETDPTVAHILRLADRALVRGNFLANRNAISATRMMSFELGLRRSLRYRGELLVRVLFRARMWETLPLPDALFSLYPLLSPIEWVFFRLRRSRE